MRCPRCDHDNPRRVSHCEVCGTPLGAAPAPAPILSPGHRQTSFEPAPVLPPPGATPAPGPPGPAAPGVPPGFGPLPPPVPSSYGGSGQAAPRRTVAEPSPVLPPRAGSAPALTPSPAAVSLAGTLPLEAPPWVDPPAPRPPVAPGAASAAGTMPSGVPAYDPRSPAQGLAGHTAPAPPAGHTTPAPPAAYTAPAPPAHARASNPALPPAYPPAPPAASPAAAFAPAPRPIPAARPLEATQVAQGPELGVLPLRGALFEYQGAGHQGFIHTLRAGRNVIGRDPGQCDVVIEGERVTRVHAYLFIRGDEVSLLDISTNGSVVDGRTVHGAEAHLRSPSVIEIGGSRLVFVLVPRQCIDGGP